MRSGVCWEGVIIVVMTVSSGTSHTVFWISLVLALPELATRLRGVAVLWSWTECLLLLVVLDKEKGQRDGQEEEDTVGGMLVTKQQEM